MPDYTVDVQVTGYVTGTTFIEAKAFTSGGSVMVSSPAETGVPLMGPPLTITLGPATLDASESFWINFVCLNSGGYLDAKSIGPYTVADDATPV